MRAGADIWSNVSSTPEQCICARMMRLPWGQSNFLLIGRICKASVDRSSIPGIAPRQDRAGRPDGPDRGYLRGQGGPNDAGGVDRVAYPRALAFAGQADDLQRWRMAPDGVPTVRRCIVFDRAVRGGKDSGAIGRGRFGYAFPAVGPHDSNGRCWRAVALDRAPASAHRRRLKAGVNGRGMARSYAVNAQRHGQGCFSLGICLSKTIATKRAPAGCLDIPTRHYYS